MFTKLYTYMCVQFFNTNMCIQIYVYKYTNICIQIYVYKYMRTNMCIQIYVYGMCIQTEIFKYSNLIKTKKNHQNRKKQESFYLYF